MFDEHDDLMSEWDWTIRNGWHVVHELEIGDEQRKLDFELNEEIRERESA
jgi:hypothetical protein